MVNKSGLSVYYCGHTYPGHPPGAGPTSGAVLGYIDIFLNTELALDQCSEILPPAPLPPGLGEEGDAGSNGGSLQTVGTAGG